MTKNEMMKVISEAVGRPEAVRLVAEAYNSEILANRLSRMETDPKGIRREKKDLLLQAMQRVLDVVELM